MSETRMFPILKPRYGDPKEYIPWDFLAPHEHQALRNHDQTLKRLAERGGLGWNEVLDIITGNKWDWHRRKGVSESEARERVNALVDRWNNADFRRSISLIFTATKLGVLQWSIDEATREEAYARRYECRGRSGTEPPHVHLEDEDE